jgi:hypothetical protein
MRAGKPVSHPIRRLRHSCMSDQDILPVLTANDRGLLHVDGRNGFLHMIGGFFQISDYRSGERIDYKTTWQGVGGCRVSSSPLVLVNLERRCR